jgi:hypothetical protein
MKTVIAILAVVSSVCVQPVFGQQNSPMYDRSYSGPYNMYGQPTFTQLPPTQRQAVQQQQANQAVIPRAVDRIGDLGSYLWSYMPAPVRGADSPYAVPPGSGQVNVNFVPGSR